MHATLVCKSANYNLHCIRKIGNWLSLDICKLLVHTLITVLLNYGNALRYGARDDVIRQSTIDALQDIYYQQTTLTL